MNTSSDWACADLEPGEMGSLPLYVPLYVHEAVGFLALYFPDRGLEERAC